MSKIDLQAPMIHSEEVVRQHALQRLAEVFRFPESSLSNEARFGHELKAAPASDFKSNEFDIIDDDIKDVADSLLLKKMLQGVLVIRTVGEYCDHMVKCSSLKPKEVARVLRLPVEGAEQTGAAHDI
ncbi:hypothetical protein J5J83_08520 [Azoarcus sp. L1K30]|uniref:hypothetical protein n=1 Tax=Azoarcus sp. L1K30 TaxID=2820277 RepID=UPI001B82445E|nr:hypothetical protein [Azoarcus sp. L1K30]MBR0566158.1 hypothetical protein [Azoarcus sp. L1K30]